MQQVKYNYDTHAWIMTIDGQQCFIEIQESLYRYGSFYHYGIDFHSGQEVQGYDLGL